MGWEIDKVNYSTPNPPTIYLPYSLYTHHLALLNIFSFIIKHYRYVKVSGTSHWTYFSPFLCIGNCCVQFIFSRNICINQINLISIKSKWVKLGREMFMVRNLTPYLEVIVIKPILALDFFILLYLNVQYWLFKDFSC